MGNCVCCVDNPPPLHALFASTDLISRGSNSFSSNSTSYLHVWEFLAEENRPVALSDLVSFSSNCCYLILHVFVESSNKQKAESIEGNLSSLISSAAETLTPRGLSSPLVEGKVETSAEARNLYYDLFLWNGKSSTDVTQAVALAKGKELELRLRRRLSNPEDSGPHSVPRNALEELISEKEEDNSHSTLKGDQLLLHAMRAEEAVPLSKLRQHLHNDPVEPAQPLPSILLVDRIMGIKKGGKRRRIIASRRSARQRVASDEDNSDQGSSEEESDSEEESEEEESEEEEDEDSSASSSESESEYESDGEDEHKPTNLKHTPERKGPPLLFMKPGGFTLDIKKVKDDENGKDDKKQRGETPKSKRWLIKKYMNECSKISDEFYLGAEPVAKDKEVLKKNHITHILNCAGTVMLDEFASDFEYKTLHLADGEKEDITCLFYDVLDWLRDAIEKGGKIFVHCQQGVSRSSAMLIMYFMWKKNMEFQPTHEWVKELRPISNPNANFTSALLRWWQRIHSPIEPKKPRIFRVIPHCRAAPDEIVLRLVDNHSAKALDQRGCFIVVTHNRLYQWRGKECPDFLYSFVEIYTKRLREYENAPSDVAEILAGKETPEFWSCFSDAADSAITISYNDDYDDYYLLGLYGHEREPCMARKGPPNSNPRWLIFDKADRKYLKSDGIFVVYNNKRTTEGKIFVWLGSTAHDGLTAISFSSATEEEVEEEGNDTKTEMEQLASSIARDFLLFFRGPIQTRVEVVREGEETEEFFSLCS